MRGHDPEAGLNGRAHTPPHYQVHSVCELHTPIWSWQVLVPRWSFSSVPLGRFPCKCRRKCTGENRGQVVWRKEVGKSKEADSCSMRAGLWTHRHRLCPMHLCASLGWSQAKAECSSHVLGEEIMQIIFSQGVVKEMDSGRNTEGKSAKWEHSFHWRARISPWGGVAFEKGFEGRKGCEN